MMNIGCYGGVLEAKLSASSLTPVLTADGRLMRQADAAG